MAAARRGNGRGKASAERETLPLSSARLISPFLLPLLAAVTQAKTRFKRISNALQTKTPLKYFCDKPPIDTEGHIYESAYHDFTLQFPHFCGFFSVALSQIVVFFLCVLFLSTVTLLREEHQKEEKVLNNINGFPESEDFQHIQYILTYLPITRKKIRNSLRL